MYDLFSTADIANSIIVFLKFVNERYMKYTLNCTKEKIYLFFFVEKSIFNFLAKLCLVFLTLVYMSL